MLKPLKNLKDSQMNTNLVMPRGERSSQESPHYVKKSVSPLRIKKAMAVVNSEREKSSRKNSPYRKYEISSSSKKIYDQTLYSNNKYENSSGRYSPLKNYRTKAQNVIEKYAQKPAPK
jgi:hypothetical protein